MDSLEQVDPGIQHYLALLVVVFFQTEHNAALKVVVSYISHKLKLRSFWASAVKQ